MQGLWVDLFNYMRRICLKKYNCIQTSPQRLAWGQTGGRGRYCSKTWVPL